MAERQPQQYQPRKVYVESGPQPDGSTVWTATMIFEPGTKGIIALTQIGDSKIEVLRRFGQSFQTYRNEGLIEDRK